MAFKTCIVCFTVCFTVKLAGPNAYPHSCQSGLQASVTVQSPSVWSPFSIQLFATYLFLVGLQVLEAFQPKGLFGSGECLELYGEVASAPDLTSSAGKEDQGVKAPNLARARRDAIKGRPEMGGDERLAECLATPFTGDDKNLGEIVEEEARQAMKQSQLRTQLRYP